MSDDRKPPVTNTFPGSDAREYDEPMRDAVEEARSLGAMLQRVAELEADLAVYQAGYATAEHGRVTCEAQLADARGQARRETVAVFAAWFDDYAETLIGQPGISELRALLATMAA